MDEYSPPLSLPFPTWNNVEYKKCSKAPKSTQLTNLGHKVDKHVKLASLENLAVEGADIERGVEYPQSAPAADAGVEDGRLDAGILLRSQFVVVFYLDSNRLVAIYARQLHVDGVRHVEVAEKVNRSNS